MNELNQKNTTTQQQGLRSVCSHAAGSRASALTKLKAQLKPQLKTGFSLGQFNPERSPLSMRRSLLSLLMMAGIGAGATISVPAMASACKGQAETACVSDSACSWIKSYERKDGRAVKGFCRTKSKGVKTKTKQQPQSKAMN